MQYSIPKRLVFCFATLATLINVEEARAASLFTLGNPYRHFQHQKYIAPNWIEAFAGCCYLTSAATVSMSIADNNAGITLNGFTNTSLGAEVFEASYGFPPLFGVTANEVNGAIPKWNGLGGWVNAPWFMGPDSAHIRVQDYYFDGFGSNWRDIAKTLPAYNIIGAFALMKALEPIETDFEWWSNYHVVGVYDFDLEGRVMKIVDSNKDRNNVEWKNIFPPAAAVGGDILKGVGTLDTIAWEDKTGKLTNNDGNNMDDEQLVSLRVLYNIGDKKDSGDAPDSFKTLRASDGPRYFDGDFQRLGENWDGEEDGQPTLNAIGDDFLQWSDEDGVIFGDSWVDIMFNINRPEEHIYQLRAWWDTNTNGAFDHATELLIDDLLTLGPGTITKRYNLGFNPKPYYSRFRLTWIDDPYGISGGVALSTDIQPFGEYLGSDGISHGEVEDYAPVPGPLPIFGVAAAFRYSRRLRTRIKQTQNLINR